ncbi:DUF3850 domain-containing protein [Providencia manganoxydans]|uniref:DUF3850 domain-containing protein n=1 Tax=Providencia manganoxydans TaxID=2923283 RepID=UPI0034E4FEAA
MKNSETKNIQIGFDPAAPENVDYSISSHIVRHHDLKIAPKYFNRIISGEKTAEIRRNDRDFRSGDMMTLREFRSIIQTYPNHPAARYTGRTVGCCITDVVIVNEVFPDLLRGKPELVMLSFRVIHING